MARLPIEDFTEFGADVAPNFDLEISGRDASGAAELFDAIRPLVSGVSFEDDEEMSSMFELTVINQPDTEPGKKVDWRAVIDSKAFTEGNYIDLYMGYGSDREFIDRAEIVKWLPVFDVGGPTEFTIKGYDGRHRMQIGNQFKAAGGSAGGQLVVKKDPKTLESVTTRTGGAGGAGGSGGTKKRKTFFRNLSDDKIVQKIAAKYGYAVNFDIPEQRKKAVKTVVRNKKTGKTTTKKQSVFPTRVQGSDVSDWEFLQRLAEINRFDLWCDYDQDKGLFVVNFTKRQDTAAPGYKFVYNGEDGSLIKAEPDFAIKDQPTDVEVLVYDRKKRAIERTIITDTTKAEDVKLSGSRVARGQMTAKKSIEVGARVRFSAFGQVHEAFSDKPFRSKKQAAAFVQNWIKERERDFLTLQGVVIGLPSLRSRQIHEIEGLGVRLDGLYRFTNVKHRMVPGQLYTCEFTAHKVLSTEIARRAPTTKTQATSKGVTAAG
jgi:phage protein D